MEQNQVTKEISKGAITVDRVYVADYQKEGSETAELRQEVTIRSKYPSVQTETDMQNGLFSNSAFGYEPKVFESVEKRVAWIPVPKGTTIQQVEALLATKPAACIYKVLSNEPILDKNQQYAIDAGLKTKDDFANAQVARYPENHEKAGEVILDKNEKVQYRRTFFWNVAHEDMDLRTADATQYLSEEIALELKGASILENQNIAG